MQLPLLIRAPMAAHQDVNASLGIRLRQIHQRRRRVFIRRLLTAAFWSAGLLGGAAFVFAVTLGVNQT
jgi:hypothetical protein